MNRIFLLVVLLSLAFTANTNAAAVLDQNQPDSSTYMASFSQGDLAQSFQQSNNNISGAGIHLMSGVGSTDTVTIALWDALPNEGGTLLASGSGIGTEGSWLDVFWDPVLVTPDSTLYLVFTSVNDTLGIYGSTSNPYDRGMVFANTDFSSFPTFDYTFRTYYESSPVPIPAAVWLFGSGIIGLLGFSKRKKEV